MEGSTKLVNWFEIPVRNIERSIAFYNEVFGLELEFVEMDAIKFGIFPAVPPATGGAIVEGEGYVPSETGIRIFFEAGDKIDTVLDRVGPAGGKVVMSKFKVNDDIGEIAFFTDLDYNRIGLHSPMLKG